MELFDAEVAAARALYGDGAVAVTGGGATVAVRLPLSLCGGELRVLAAADSAQLRRAQRHLARFAHRIRWAENGCMEFSVRHLPEVTLHAGYAPPMAFEISAGWLGDELLSAANEMLQGKASEVAEDSELYGGALMGICDWLQNELLASLDIKSTLIMQLDPYETTMGNILQILNHDMLEGEKRWQQDTHECLICYVELPGIELHRYPTCWHAFCASCIKAYVSEQAAVGRFDDLPCPVPGCESSASTQVLQAAMGGEAFARWEELSFNRYLDKAADLDWCARCGKVAGKTPQPQAPLASSSGSGTDAQPPVAVCAYCHYAYCARCRRPPHGATQLCDDGAALGVLVDDVEADDADGDAADDEGDDEVDEARLANLRRVRDNRSERAIPRIAVRCPTCAAAVSRDGGCDKVTCAMCRVAFCWRCRKAVDRGYAHFEQCAAEPAVPDAGRAQQRGIVAAVERTVYAYPPIPLPAPEHMVRETRSCPHCGRRRNRFYGTMAAKDNLAKCDHCHRAFCFVCAAPLGGAGAKHFVGRGAKCKRYS